MLRRAFHRLVHEPSVLVTVARHPGETWSRLYDDYVYSRERDRRPQCPYQWTTDWEERLHHLLGDAWPCADTAAPGALWPPIIASLAAHGIDVGPESFQCWNDGDPALIRAIWCLVRHLRPAKIVETGVAHGVSSRFIIEALEANGSGHLWSIDLPPLRQVWQDQVGIVIEDRHRPRWTLLRGSSRHELGPLLKRLGTIDLFIHDSLHSERNLRFEMDEAWSRLRPGGAMVVDDVDANWAFHSFITTHRGLTALVCEAEPVRPDIRRFNQKGLFGIILKDRKPE